MDAKQDRHKRRRSGYRKVRSWGVGGQALLLMLMDVVYRQYVTLRLEESRFVIVCTVIYI